MLETLTNSYIELSNASKHNPIMAGVFSLWGLSVLTYLLRNLPVTIATFVYNQLTTSMTFNTAGDESNLIIFNNFNEWFIKRTGSKFSRSVSMSKLTYYDRKEDQEGRIGAGYGLHFFTYKGRLFWFKKYKLDSSSTNAIKEEIKLFTFGRNHSVYIDLILAFVPLRKQDQLSLFNFNNSDWDFVSHTKKRDIGTVVTHGNVKETIIETLEEFFSSKEWYDTRGFNYKQTILLYGPPGTGKTSLIKAIATYFNRNIYSMNLAEMSSKTFELAIRKLPKGSFCLIEDFDDTSAVKTRFNNNVSDLKNNVTVATTEADPLNSLMGDFSLLNLSTILNTLDGVGELDDIVIFLTTNCIDKIDPALLRKGRIDHKLYVGHLHNEDIKRYCKLVFPEIEELPEYEFEPILGCDLSALFKEHKHSHIDFLKAIPQQRPILNTQVSCK